VSTETIDSFYQGMKERGRELPSHAAKLELARFVKDNLRSGDVVLSFDPGLVAWETRNAAVGLPVDAETASKIYHRFVRFDTIILVSPLPQARLYSYASDWDELAAGRRTFLEFRPEKELSLATGERVVLLRDHAAERR
jgi:hypothetical protein